MEIKQEVDLRPYNSFGVSAVAAELVELADAGQLPDVLEYADSHHLPVMLLGHGSNVLFVNDFPGLVIHMATQGMEWDESSKQVSVAAGENWHDFVSQCMKKGFHGIENLALIPGSVGAAPVQNIGAYGVELEQFLVSVEVFDRRSREFNSLNREQCDFAYRDSIFKRDQGGNLIITSVRLQLGDWEPVVAYQGLKEALDGQTLTPQLLFDTVCQIRQSKLPDPDQLGNAGSFFKNPVVSDDKYMKLKKDYPDLPHYPSGESGFVKLPAAWLLDALGWKGKQRGAAAVHQDHALVLVNPEGKASGEDIFLLAQAMSSSVLNQFGIALQPEVRII